MRLRLEQICQSEWGGDFFLVEPLLGGLLRQAVGTVFCTASSAGERAGQ